MGIINAATTAASTVTSVVSSGPASAVTSVADSVTGAVSGASNLLTPLNASAAALPNPLSSYATYDYIIGLTAIRDTEVNFPDSTYMAGKTQAALICKSASVNPNNRVSTPFGKFEFYIENLTIESAITSNKLTTLEFEVFEPYSLFMFPTSMQQAAYQTGYDNWRDATYLLSVEFRGNQELGTMQTIPNCNRYIPVKLTTMTINASESGTRYRVSGYAVNDFAKTKEHAELKVDVSIKGKTVQEILQTGEQSLQAVVNQRLRALKDEKKIVSEPDEILILFPEEISSASTPASTGSSNEVKTSATASPQVLSANASVYKKLGVSEGINKTLVQPIGQCNEIGKAKTGLSASRKGRTPMAKPGEVYDGSIYKGSSLKIDPSEGSYNFLQKQDIQTVINEVIMSSDYVNQCFDQSSIDSSTGMRNIWTIDTQVYYKSIKSNVKDTGVAPRIIVYRVIPYKAHSSTVAAPNTKPIGIEKIKKTVIKKYDYLYTGKNTEVLKFNIDFSISYSNILAADAGMSNIDSKLFKETALQTADEIKKSNFGKGGTSEKDSNTVQAKYINAELDSDNQGGQPDTPNTRIARVFFDALNKNRDMVMLDMEIMGDPYWIPQTGMGNYVAAKGSRPGLAKDGSVDYLRTQVHTYVTFRTPLDINQATGMYNFGSSAETTTGSVVEFSGVYCVTNVTNQFRSGRFVQVLKGFRLTGQERKASSTPDQTLNNSQPDVSQKDEKLNYEGERNASIDP